MHTYVHLCHVPTLDTWALPQIAWLEWVQRCCTELFQAFEPNQLNGSFSQLYRKTRSDHRSRQLFIQGHGSGKMWIQHGENSSWRSFADFSLYSVCSALTNWPFTVLLLKWTGYRACVLMTFYTVRWLAITCVFFVQGCGHTAVSVQRNPGRVPLRWCRVDWPQWCVAGRDLQMGGWYIS